MTLKSLPVKIFVLLGFVAFFVSSVYRAHFLYGERTDLLICLNAARNLWEGLLVYDINQLWAHTKPPFATLLFLPLELLGRHIVVPLWDVLNVGVLFAMSYFAALQIHRRFKWDVFYTTLFGVFLVTNFWGYELRFGQYNILTLAMLWWAGRTSRPSLSSVLFWSAFFIKPSNLLFAPWIWHSQVSKSETHKRKLLASSFIFLGLLSLSYGLLFGVARVWQDHFEWLAFMKLATAKYLMRDVNFGFPLLFGYWTKSSWPQHLLLLASVFWAWLWTQRNKDTLQVFGVAGALSLMASPMTWWATFSILLPLSLFIVAESLHALRRRKDMAFSLFGIAVVILGTQLIFPNPLMAFENRLSNPNWGYLFYLIWAFRGKRDVSASHS